MGTTKSIDHVHNHELETKCPSNESATDCIKTPIVSLYKFHQVLGYGRFGIIYKVSEKSNFSNGKFFALKCVDKIYGLKEAEILRKLDHPNIIKTYEIFEEKDKIYILMEYLSGGNIIEYIQNSEDKSELFKANIFQKLLKAIQYLHNNGISHRDIKPENILFTSKEKDAELKIIDFGLSKQFKKFEKNGRTTITKMTSKVGSLLFIAPEIIKNDDYNEQCDIWSLGVILYLIICNKMPFYTWSSDSHNEDEYIKEKKIIFNDDKNFEFFSKSGKNLLKKLLQKDPEKRITIEKALKHKWFNNINKNKLYDYCLINKDVINILNLMKKEKYYKNLKEKILMKYFQESDFKLYKELFQKIDKENKGKITIKNLKIFYKFFKINISNDEIVQLLSEYKNNEMLYSDFLSLLIPLEIIEKKESENNSFNYINNNIVINISHFANNKTLIGNN